MSSLTGPPSYVPTLTEVVHPVATPDSAFSAGIAPDKAAAEMQELLVQRVLQRIDLMLERGLHDAIERLMLAHTRALMPRLHEEIGLVVRESVKQAFVQESSPSPSSPEIIEQPGF